MDLPEWLRMRGTLVYKLHTLLVFLGERPTVANKTTNELDVYQVKTAYVLV